MALERHRKLDAAPAPARRSPGELGNFPLTLTAPADSSRRAAHCCPGGFLQGGDSVLLPGPPDPS